MRKSAELPPPVWARKDNPESKPNWEALWAWAKDPDRKPPVLAFTSGLERDIADLASFILEREQERCVKAAKLFVGSNLTADRAVEIIIKKIKDRK